MEGVYSDRFPTFAYCYDNILFNLSIICFQDKTETDINIHQKSPTIFKVHSAESPLNRLASIDKGFYMLLFCVS